jgi:uncharacterized membrane protein YdjX (TVP38/TMEM64 family)
MNIRKAIEWQWRFTRWFLIVALIVPPAIVLINFASAISAGEPLPWIDALAAVAFMLAATAMVWGARHWYNFVAGDEVCKWRTDR